ncbi:PLP-dependent aminotransferase family protein [Mucilaginibacter sp.]|jgi:GntR family transcriptional regulator/MocR family aminotransferase|uniref:MocR-like pyridoxine biosynthesis transcription factor PdxR n=1 Tax=Mucilaginibacter sp. TaxID=1882438 RepID=UPI002BD91422|nr:PLP-dependent aminotransferase family protein [Mucilaginibacter sp.]HTI59863.1 PLP-dependent aminotransferase family protein [Mucilaginibacter sp.]
MSILESLLIIDKDLSVPVYLQITNGVIGHIRRGALKPESMLPSSRTLAAALHVHRKTVIAAYDELYAQSWVDVYPRKGIFVAKNLPDVTPRPLTGSDGVSNLPTKTFFDVNDDHVPFPHPYKAVPEHHLVFNDGFPDTRIAPIDLLVREYRRFGNYRFTSKYLMYGPEQGSENLRNELARFLSESRGLHVSAESILITKGVQMAMYLTAQILLSKGDTVIAADPGYPGANEIFEHAGAQMAFVPVDEHGIDLDAVEAICKKRKVKLLYVIPHHHRPTTVTLSSERRMRLLELAMKYRFAILEDDYDYDFHYSSSPILPLASADYYGSVIYVGSFCKTIAPGIRIGFVVAPQNLIIQLTRLRRMIDRQGEQLLEEAMANLLKNGDISRHLKKANKIYHERRDTLCRLLDEQLGEHLSFKIPDGGFAIWVKYMKGLNAAIISRHAAAMGLSVSDGNDYYHASVSQRHVRVGFASLNLDELERAVEIWGRAVKKSLH